MSFAREALLKTLRDTTPEEALETLRNLGYLNEDGSYGPVMEAIQKKTSEKSLDGLKSSRGPNAIELDVGNGPFWCDVEMCSLIEALNAVGLRTTQCCSGHGQSPAYISIALDRGTTAAIRVEDSGTRLVIEWPLVEDD